MATAKKMPSGNYRVRIYDKATGKQKSFTAETKKEAEYLANEWLTGRQKVVIKHDITVGEAVRTYIDSKNNVLSASTIRGYEIVYRNGLNGIRDINIDDLTTMQLQYWINSNAKKYSPKTLRNQFGLVTAALRQKKVRLDFDDVTLKKKTKTETAMLLSETITNFTIQRKKQKTQRRKKEKIIRRKQKKAKSQKRRNSSLRQKRYMSPHNQNLQNLM